MHFLSLFLALNEGILKIPGNKLIPNGYNIDKAKLINVSLNKKVWVFPHTPQKHDIKYQKNNINDKLIIKNKIIFIFIYLSIFFDFSTLATISFSSFIFNISFSCF